MSGMELCGACLFITRSLLVIRYGLGFMVWTAKMVKHNLGNLQCEMQPSITGLCPAKLCNPQNFGLNPIFPRFAACN
jgi:hypothetical protein